MLEKLNQVKLEQMSYSTLGCKFALEIRSFTYPEY